VLPTGTVAKQVSRERLRPVQRGELNFLISGAVMVVSAPATAVLRQFSDLARQKVEKAVKAVK